jgi:prepilin signal peptidase PulO-like enzyme (type II secretory pathway)
MSSAAVAAAAGVLGAPVGWLTWRIAQPFIDRRSLEKGDTELRLPLPTAAVCNIVMYAALGWRFADDLPVLAVQLAVFGALQVLLLVDFGRYYLPNELIGWTLLGGTILVVIVSLATGHADAIVFALVGVVVNFVVFGVFWFVAMLAFGDRGLGFGDVKLASVLGLVIGWSVTSYRDLWVLVFWGVFIGFLSGAILSIILLRGVNLKQSFPQGPFLVLGTLVVIVGSANFL